jgi:hypothetical protein
VGRNRSSPGKRGTVEHCQGGRCQEGRWGLGGDDGYFRPYIRLLSLRKRKKLASHFTR